MKRTRFRSTVLAGICAVSLAATAACGVGGGASEQSGGGGEQGGIDDTIHIAQVQDLTGPVAYAGVGANEGAKLAIEQINEQDFFGNGAKIELGEFDAAGEIDRAASEMSKAMADSKYSAILGPVSTQQAATVAPMIGKQKVPTVFTQAGGDGVVINDYTFRITPPMETYYETTMDWLQEQDVKDISILYNGTYPTFAEMGKGSIPKLAKERGIEVSQSLTVESSTQNFTGHAQRIASNDADALVMLLIAPQSVTAMKQLKSAGYDNQVVATSVQAAGNIAEAGDAANGLVYPVPFSAALEGKSSVEFTKAFKAKYDKKPDPYNADGYDAMWWIARAIKASGDSSREGIREGLETVAEEGFSGAIGDITFEDGHDARIKGSLVKWQDGKEILVQEH